MAQFDIHRIANGSLVLDCQAESLSHFSTRIVAPLMRQGSVPAPATRLHPIFDHEGEPMLLATHLLTAMPMRDLGRPLASLETERYTIMAALDLLLTGV